MIPAEQLAQTFKSNHWLACRLLEGISHDESLLTPEFQANCINWLIGHMIVGRDRALKALASPLIFGEAEKELYQTGSASLQKERALPLENLHAALDETQARLEQALSQVSEEFLAEIISTRFGDRPRWQHISGLGWHETYHVGQLELLRQLALELRKEAA